MAIDLGTSVTPSNIITCIIGVIEEKERSGKFPLRNDSCTIF